MSDNRKKVLLRLVFTTAVLLWMILIFSLSAQNAAASGKTSGGFSKLLFSWFYPGFRKFTEEHQNEIISAAAKLIRKAAHFFLYFVLGGLLRITVPLYRVRKMFWQGASAFAIGALYACSDELHQRFVPGRSGEFGDVLLDSIAALTAVLIIGAVLYRRRAKQSKVGG